MPSQLLERRPDITAGGSHPDRGQRTHWRRQSAVLSADLADQPWRIRQQSAAGMFAGKNAYWYAAGSLSEPIFDAGRIRSNYHLSQAQEQEVLLDYQKTNPERAEGRLRLLGRLQGDAGAAGAAGGAGGLCGGRGCGRRDCATPAETPAISRCSPPIQTCMTRNCNWRKARSRRRPRWCSCTPRWAAVGNSGCRLFPGRGGQGHGVW